MDAVRPLNYAPKPSIRQRFSRRVYRLILVAAVIIAGVAWGPGLWRHAQQLYWEYECLNFSLPANHVVWEMDRGKVTRADVNMPQRKLGKRLYLTSFGPIFLHEMRRPSGSRCLISLALLNPFISGVDQFHIEYLQWNVSFSPTLSPTHYINISTTGSLMSHYKFFAGQLDLNNASHLTFDFEVDGRRHTCDGWLNNDGDLIVSQRP